MTRLARQVLAGTTDHRPLPVKFWPRRTHRFGIVSAEMDLNRERRLQWLSVGPGDGEARSLYIHQQPADTYGPLQ